MYEIDVNCLEVGDNRNHYHGYDVVFSMNMTRFYTVMFDLSMKCTMWWLSVD